MDILGFNKIKEEDKSKYFVIRKSTFGIAILIFLIQFIYIGWFVKMEHSWIHTQTTLFFLLFLFASLSGHSIIFVLKELKDTFCFKKKFEDGFLVKKMKIIHNKIKGREDKHFGDRK